MRKIFTILLLVQCSVALWASQVCVSVYPLSVIARQLVPQGVSVLYVVPPGADPHHFEPTPSTVRSIQNASLFLGVDDHFDGWIRRFLPKNCPTHYLKTETDPDEHVWLGFQAGRDTASRMHAVLRTTFPDRQTELDANLAAFLKRMDDGERQARTVLEPYAGQRFVQYHPAWDRFAEEMGLTITGTLSGGHGHEISPRTLANLIRTSRETGTRVVAIGLRKQSRTVETFVREINGVRVNLDAIGDPDDPSRDEFPELLIYNATQLAKGFQ